jgi:hypothetical protein
VFRYYVLATLIVVAIGGIVFAHRMTSPDLQISAQPTGTPTVETRVPDAPARATPRPFSGQGPWVFSALPGCFDEQFRARGPIGDLRSTFPPASDRIAPGTTFRVKACTVIVRAHDIWIDRGDDRLRVPPDAALYRVGTQLVLTARTGGTVEIRRY